MTAPSETIERKDAASRRQEIADAALKVIAEQGLGRFTALAIAREVGVSDAALFRHFPTKQAIVLAAIARVEERLLATFPPPEGDPIDRLGRFFEARVASIRENPGIARLVASEQLAQAAPPEGVARVAALRRRSVEFIGRCLEEAEASRLLAEGVEPDVAKTLVLGAILSLTQGPIAGAGPGSLAARTWQALEGTLRRAGAAAARDGKRPAHTHGRRKP
ncbi:MAG TPA: TetR/AcrR family transcriptional regulator [Anaeromyxobacteraceae bacterium]|nr:TetR/AcrR family transcriptional regulator [Anaeromyxobacteraceae bacterium]